jgi:hypothetical protein
MCLSAATAAVCVVVAHRVHSKEHIRTAEMQLGLRNKKKTNSVALSPQANCTD